MKNFTMWRNFIPSDFMYLILKNSKKESQFSVHIKDKDKGKIKKLIANKRD